MKKTQEMGKYNPYEIEKKWQDTWEKKGVFYAERDKSKPKYYALIEFPYPSGEGLHVGTPRSYIALDIIARKRRMEGYNVLYPIGWDAFGLPTENYAIKNRIHPEKVTERNIGRYRKQLKSIGLSFDWSREVNTTDPEYYRWTQWIFLKMYKKGLAYKAEVPINWCTVCKVGLANEEVVDGVCERCGGEIIRKVKSQWMLKITDYAEKLLEGLETVDYIEKVKVQQKNWIGRSEGVEADFAISGKKSAVRIYTTRPDTLFGATYMVISPEHPLIDELKDSIANWDRVEEYRRQACGKSDFERTEMSKEKTGIPLEGVKAVNPASMQEIPIWISDYVLMSYGTGAIMAVPAHDARDWEFARKYGLPVVEVVKGGNIEQEAYIDIETGIMINSGFLDGLTVRDAMEKISGWLEEKGLGRRKTNYKLRDWVFSRQRYWGEPIPVIFCEKCGWVPVPEDQLPLTLPEVENYTVTGTEQSPLACISDWVETSCPVCGGPGKRETDTMPQWAGSSWYFLRYADPRNNREFAFGEELGYWLPVDWYNGGMEHTTLHLLYSRFWHRFLYEEGLVPTPEPYGKRTSHGMILGDNNEKMSKSRGNVVNPDDIINEFGADTFRVYEMFMGAFDQPIPWSRQGIRGCRKFLERVWKLQEMLVEGDGYSGDLKVLFHRTLKKVSEDYERMKFNTAIAAIMSLINEIYNVNRITRGEMKSLLIILNPAAPHITEELWQIAGFEDELNRNRWVTWDEAVTAGEMMEIAVQVNGRVRDVVKVSRTAMQEDIRAEILKLESIQKHTTGKVIVNEFYVEGKVYNLVVR